MAAGIQLLHDSTAVGLAHERCAGPRYVVLMGPGRGKDNGLRAQTTFRPPPAARHGRRRSRVPDRRNPPDGRPPRRSLRTGRRLFLGRLHARPYGRGEPADPARPRLSRFPADGRGGGAAPRWHRRRRHLQPDRQPPCRCRRVSGPRCRRDLRQTDDLDARRSRRPREGGAQERPPVLPHPQLHRLSHGAGGAGAHRRRRDRRRAPGHRGISDRNLPHGRRRARCGQAPLALRSGTRRGGRHPRRGRHPCASHGELRLRPGGCGRIGDHGNIHAGTARLRQRLSRP